MPEKLTGYVDAVRPIAPYIVAALFLGNLLAATIFGTPVHVDLWGAAASIAPCMPAGVELRADGVIIEPEQIKGYVIETDRGQQVIDLDDLDAHPIEAE